MSYLTTALLIGFLSLDTTVAFQVLIAQPLFACPILGFLLGDVETGLQIGLLMQLLWLSAIPAGASKFPEGNIASMVTCAIVIYFKDIEFPNTILSIAFLWGLAVSSAGSFLTVLDRKINGYLLSYVIKAAENADLRRINLMEILGILLYFLLMSALAYVSLIVADFTIDALKPYFNGIMENKLGIVQPVILGIGIALTIPMVYRSLKQKS